MICPKCGAKLEEGTRVCPICGKSLVATSVGTVFKRRDLQEYDELSSDEYDDSDYQDDGSYEEEQYDDTYQDDEYDDGSYEEEQYDDGYEAESGPYDNENNAAYFSDQSDEKPVKKKSIANKILGGMILICLAAPAEASATSLSRGIVAIVACSLVLSALFGMNGVWAAFPASEAITACLTLFLLERKKRAA